MKHFVSETKFYHNLEVFLPMRAFAHLVHKLIHRLHGMQADEYSDPQKGLQAGL
jgi:hypothetical protein